MNDQQGFKRSNLLASAIIALGLVAQQASAAQLALEEVIVTAQKKSESLQATPISVAAFNASGLEDHSINTLIDLQSLVPNMQMTPHPNSGASTRVFMRGVGNEDDDITQDPSVAVYLDGVYLARSQGLAMEVGDIERIEVLRGPQGSLYGRNATGGAINFITVAPSLDGFGFKQGFTLGNRNELRSKTTVNLPVTDDLAVKLGYLMASKDGFVENLGTGEGRYGDQDRTAYRLDALWQPADDLSVRYAYDRSNIDDTPNFVAVVPIHPGQGKRPSANNPGVTGLQSNDITSQGHMVSLDWHINADMSFKSISSYRKLDNQTYQDFHYGIYGPFSLFQPTVDSEQDQFTQEFQLLGVALDDSLDYIVGAYYFEEEADGSRDTVVTTSGGTSLSVTSVKNSAYALFGQATYTPDVMEKRLHVTLGLRWSVDKREATQLDGFQPFSGPAIPSTLSRGSEKFDEFNPSLVVAYDWTDNINVYGKVVTGYKTGGFNTRASSPARFKEGFDPETLITYELGVKSELWDNRVRLNMAAFTTDYEDIQVNVQSDPTNISIADILNAGEAKINGLELDLSALLTENLTLNVKYGYLDAEYTQVKDATGTDIKNIFRFSNTPKHSYSADVEYQLPRLAVGQLTAIISYSWQDEIFTNAVIDGGEYITDNYGLLNARLSLSEMSMPAGDLRVALWGRNLEDKQYYAAHFDAAVPSSIYGEPRSYGIDLTYEF